MNKVILFTMLAISLVGYIQAAAEKLIFCAVGTWAAYRKGNGNFDVSDIDPNMCTHLMYGFFGIDTDGTVKILDPFLDLKENYGRGNIKKFNGLKKINPKLKTIAAVGGWNEGSSKFSVVAADPKLRARFAKNAAEFCLKYGFDGLDMDWEYPAQRDGDPVNDKANFVLLLKDIKEEFVKYDFQLMAAVAAAESSASKSYDIPNISKYLDYINVMAYDLHGAWEMKVGLNAPLYAGPNDVSEHEKQLNVDAAIQYWLSQGARKEKIILGVPFYGKTFTLSWENQHKVGSPAKGPGSAGQYTREAGMIGYNEICENMMTESWSVRYSNEQKAPFAHKGNQLISYDDIDSIQMKTKYMMDLGLAGILVWSLETDDFRGICGAGKYPLMQTILSTIHRRTPPTLPPTKPTSPTTPRSTTTRDPSLPPLGECTENGFFLQPGSCTKYYMCSGTTKYEFECPPTLLFNPSTNICDWAYNVDCTED